MKITIESTATIVTLEHCTADGRVHETQARVWQGATDSGIPVQAFVTRIAPEIAKTDPRIDELTVEFERERELKRQADPRPSVAAIPLRLII